MLIWPSLAGQWIKPETAGQQAIGDRGPTEARQQEAARRRYPTPASVLPFGGFVEQKLGPPLCGLFLGSTPAMAIVVHRDICATSCVRWPFFFAPVSMSAI